MARWSVVAIVAVVVLAVLGACVVLLSGRWSGSDEPAARRPLLRPVPRLPQRPAVQVGDGPVAARLLRRVLLRERPGGRAVRAIGTRTGYGSPRVLSVVRRRGDWLAVLSHYRPNSRVGWIPASGAVLLREPYTLHVDLSARVLIVRRGGRVKRRVLVTIGRPGNPTPTGRFAVTDLLLIGQGSGAYGCCALALTGRQPNVTQGWGGGDRLAIHGTSNVGSIGSAASGGCLRASERNMRWLLAHVQLGAPLRIQA